MSYPARIQSIDILRGLVMVIMALDHTRDFFHITAFTDDPLNLKTTTPWLFGTRWITHFCAPVFVFLSGASAYLQSLRKTKKQLSAFLITRGLWLVLAEFTLITFAITFDPHFSLLVLQVIAAIGISMIVLGLLVWLPFPAIFFIAVLIVFGHNILDYLKLPAWFLPLHEQTLIPVTKQTAIFDIYPVLPWIGIMSLGYCFGKLFRPEVENRNKKILVIGLAAVALFVLLRLLNSYGDPRHWSLQKNALFTFFSFIDTTKYPPSLMYASMTLGPALILLSFLERWKGKLAAFFLVYGRVPFFYYILHFYLIHAVSALLFFARGHTVEEGMHAYPKAPFRFFAPGEGYSLPVVYLVWISIVLFLYPLCRWYARYKATHRHWWLSYL